MHQARAAPLLGEHACLTSSFASEEARHRCGNPLCAPAMVHPHALDPRRSTGDQQQRSKTCVACRGAQSKELPVHRLSPRRRARRGHVLTARYRHTKRPQLGGQNLVGVQAVRLWVRLSGLCPQQLRIMRKKKAALWTAVAASNLPAR